MSRFEDVCIALVIAVLVALISTLISWGLILAVLWACGATR